MSKINIWIKIIIAIVLISALGYFLGYRVVDGFKIKKVGYLTLSIPFPETSVFVDQSKKIVTTKENQELKIALSPKEHSVIVAGKDHYPWKKDFLIQSDKKTNLAAIFVSQNPSGNIITKNDPEYQSLLNKIKNNLPGTIEVPKKSEEGDAEVWLEDNTIMVKKGEKVFDVIKPEDKIKNVDFYKNGSEAVIFSAGTGVYVVEINKEGSQNFMPIYKGINPEFSNGNSDYIYVLDSSTLMQVFI